jgi:hypothetical protein
MGGTFTPESKGWKWFDDVRAEPLSGDYGCAFNRIFHNWRFFR